MYFSMSHPDGMSDPTYSKSKFLKSWWLKSLFKRAFPAQIFVFPIASVKLGLSQPTSLDSVIFHFKSTHAQRCAKPWA